MLTGTEQAELRGQDGSDAHGWSGAGDSDASITVSEFTSDTYVDDRLALEFKAAKGAFPYQSPAKPTGLAMDAVDTYDQNAQTQEISRESAGTINKAAQELDGALAYMSSALPGGYTFLEEKDASSKTPSGRGLNPDSDGGTSKAVALPELGYFMETDGSWAGFNEAGKGAWGRG